MAIKLIPRRLLITCGSSSKVPCGKAEGLRRCSGGSAIKWELRPGGMLVQKREAEEEAEEKVRIRVSTGSGLLHDISVGATSTFGELKVALSMVTGLEPREQRLLYKGKERADADHLHMAGVRDADKVLLLEDPAIKEEKKKRRNLQQGQLGMGGGGGGGQCCCAIKA